MKNLILTLIVATAALPALAMPAAFRPGVGTLGPQTVSTVDIS